VTKQPLDPAYVVLKDRSGNEVNSAFTDIDGRYGFLLQPGTYTIEASKTNYTFPSKKLFGRIDDELYDGLYFGGPIITNHVGEVIIRNIPLDRENFDWNEFAKSEKNLTLFYSKRDVLKHRIYLALFVLGFIISVISLLTVPQPYNFIIFGAYTAILLLRLFGFKPKSFGAVHERSTGQSLSYGIVRIFSESLGSELSQRVLDQFGRYYALVPPGDYHITIEKKNDDASYSLVYSSPVFNSPKGVINQNFEV
jgi:hypothetical protein